MQSVRYGDFGRGYDRRHMPPLRLQGQGPKGKRHIIFLETERRVAESGPGGDLPLTKQQQETVDSVKKLEDQFQLLKSFPDNEMADKITEKEKELHKLKVKLPVMEAQEDRNQSAMHSTLAEPEDKYQREKLAIEIKIENAIKQRGEAESNRAKEKKALDELIAAKKIAIEEVAEAKIKRHEDEGKELRIQLERT